MRTAALIVMVRCLHCRHKSILTPQALAAFGVKPNAPIAAFVKRPMQQMWKRQRHGNPGRQGRSGQPPFARLGKVQSRVLRFRKRFILAGPRTKSSDDHPWPFVRRRD